MPADNPETSVLIQEDLTNCETTRTKGLNAVLAVSLLGVQPRVVLTRQAELSIAHVGALGRVRWCGPHILDFQAISRGNCQCCVGLDHARAAALLGRPHAAVERALRAVEQALKAAKARLPNDRSHSHQQL